MPSSIIRMQDCPPQPWKNGLGRTREIAVHPPGADGGGFLWRASVAEVDSAAPFSVFPGIDRHIVLLEGDGFTMTLDDHQVHALRVPFEPFAFSGEAQVAVALAGGATRDFNLMVRRERAGGGVQVWHSPGSRTADPSVALVYCARGSIATAAGVLHDGDAWRPASDASEALTLDEEAVALVVCIEPRAG
jgi:uncharacterized protein